MALVIADRVRETTTSTGTGTITLAGAYSGFQAFSVIGNGNTTYYAIIDASAGAWEVGLGTYTSVGNTLSRDTVLSSSAGGSAVNFAAGVKDVIVTQPAGRAVYLDTATNTTVPGLTVNGTQTISANSASDALRITQTGAGNALVVEDNNPDSSPLVVDTVGRLVVSADQSYQTVVTDSTTATPQVQQHGTSSTTSSVTGLYGWSGSNPYFVFSKAGAGGVGTYATVASGNTLGVIQFNGADSTNFVGAAQILGAADGTPTAGNVPGRLVFRTCVAGGVLTERLRIKSDGESWFQANNTTAAVTITQTGTGNALVVEDDTNPDSSPLVIDTNGRLITGYTAALANYNAGAALRTPQYQIQGSSISFATQSITNWATGTTATGASYLILAKSRSGTVGTQGTLTDANQYIGVLQFNGDNGTDFIPSAWIRSATDNVPNAGDMPGRLEFATTADGDSSPTEAMRITSTQEVIIGGTTAIEAGALSIHSVVGSPAINLFRNDTSVSTGNALGTIRFYGNDTTLNTLTNLASIQGVASGTHTAGDNPTDIVFSTTPSGSETITEAVRVKDGGGLQISRTTVTSPATGDGNVFSGTYTPTQVGTNTNVDGVTFSACQYMRVGNVVTVSGQIVINATVANTDTVVKMTIPVASNFTTSRQLGGTGVMVSTPYAQNSLGFLADITNDSVDIRLRPTLDTGLTYNFSFTYQVL